MQRSRLVGVLAAMVAIFSFATASAFAAPEAPTIAPVELEGLTAKLKGVLNPGAPGEVGFYEFLYRLSESECTGESSTGQAEALGAQEEQVSGEAAGLQPSAIYSFCLLARNGAEETAASPTETVTTPAAPPAIISESVEGAVAEGVISKTLTLFAMINPNNQETNYTFEYSTEATGETLEGTIVDLPGPAPLSGFGGQLTEAKPEPLQLQSSTKYFWRVVATNAAKETTNGPVETFTTALAPETPTMAPVELQGSTAQLKGTLNPAGTPEANSNYEFLFRLSETECEGESSTGQLPEAGIENEPVEAAATGLQPNATYSFCLLARNQVGDTAHSAVQTLTTAKVPPAIDSQSSAGVTSTDATLMGLINPNNQATTYEFEYSTEATEETLEGTIVKVPGAEPLPAVFADQAVETKLASLEPRTKYFWRIAATNATPEATNGKVETFTTLDAPLVTVEAAEAVTRTTAAVAGEVNPGGLSTRFHLVYVEAAHYNPGANECPQEVACAYGENAKTTPSELIGGEGDYTEHEIGPLPLEELKPGTTYHYALIATNSEGTRITADQTFTTSPATPPSASTGAASGVTQLSATLSGTADTRGLPGTLAFQVALSPEGGSLEPATVSGSQSGTSVSITFSFGPYLQPGTTYYYRAYATNADGTAAGEWRSFTTGTFPSPFAAGPPSIPLLTIPPEAIEPSGTVTVPLTRAQKLKKALKACHKLKKSKRAKCERQARRKYGLKHKK